MHITLIFMCKKQRMRIFQDWFWHFLNIFYVFFYIIFWVPNPRVFLYNRVATLLNNEGSFYCATPDKLV